MQIELYFAQFNKVTLMYSGPLLQRIDCGLPRHSMTCSNVHTTRAGHQISQHSTLQTGLREADVIYATRVQKERMSAEATEGYPARFCVNKSTIARFAPADTLILHPLPRDSSPEANDLSSDLDSDPRFAIFRQTDNGMPVRMAVFAMLLGVEAQITRTWRDANWHRPVRIGKQDAKFHRLAGS